MLAAVSVRNTLVAGAPDRLSSWHGAQCCRNTASPGDVF
jgi:hypothetical protein